MRIISSQRFLAVYSGILTLVFVATVASGAMNSPKTLNLDELEVKRINIVEPDGTLRMVISDKQDFPGLIFKGKEYTHARPLAGMLFFNDEGTENGGLVFTGYMGKDGKPVSAGHLSFDQYMQDQTMVLEGNQEGGQYRKAFTINDQPDYPLTDELPLIERWERQHSSENAAALETFQKVHGGFVQRVSLGEGKDKGVHLYMKDRQGRDRIVLSVDADGSPRLQFLDADGKLIGELPSRSGPAKQ